MYKPKESGEQQHGDEVNPEIVTRKPEDSNASARNGTATDDKQAHRTKLSRLKQAWKQTTISNKLIVAFTAVIALTNLLYVLYARRQWEVMSGQLSEMSRTDEQARTQWNAEHRPWVGSGQIGFRQPPVFLVYPNNPIQARTQINFTIQIPIKNVGIAPAFHVETELMGTMTEQITAPPDLDKMMEIACRSADNNSKHIGEVLFPNSPEITTERSEVITVPLLQITDVHRIWITTCTAYSITDSGDQLHHSRVWMASWPITGQPIEIRRAANPNVVYYSLPILQWGVIRAEAD